jgi:hemolysin activation/secretion protein
MTTARGGALKSALFLLAGTAFAFTATGSASAQILPQAQGIASPGRVQDQIPSMQTTGESASPNIDVRASQPESAPPGASKVTFVLKGIHIDGVSAYSQAEIRPVYAHELGRKISLADLYGIAAALTRKYRDDGYILTQVIVPAQTISAAGTPRLRVVEGYVDSVTIKGTKGHEAGLIESYADHLVNNIPLNERDLEHWLLLINDLPGVRARSILSPSPDKTGAAQLTIIVTRKPYDVEVDANNYGTKYLGPYQLGTSAALNSIFGLNERITGQVVYAPGAHMTPELMYYAGGYMMPVGPWGTTVQLDANYTHTAPGYSLRPFSVQGNEEFVDAILTQPFIRSRRLNLTGNVTMDERDVNTNDNIEDTRKDRIRAVRFGAKADYLSTWVAPAYNSANFEVAQGINAFGATGGTLNSSRPGADASFTKLDAEVQRLQRIVDHVNVLVAGEGQLTNNPLLTTEQFGIGGQDYGRGYDPSEILGDDGLVGKAELQWDTPFVLPYFSTYQTFLFFDGGEVFNKNALIADERHESLTSTGIGWRSTFQFGTSLDATLAFPLNREVQTQGNRDPRIFIGLSQKF